MTPKRNKAVFVIAVFGWWSPGISEKDGREA